MLALQSGAAAGGLGDEESFGGLGLVRREQKEGGGEEKSLRERKKGRKGLG